MGCDMSEAKNKKEIDYCIHYFANWSKIIQEKTSNFRDTYPTKYLRETIDICAPDGTLTLSRSYSEWQDVIKKNKEHIATLQDIKSGNKVADDKIASLLCAVDCTDVPEIAEILKARADK